MISLKFNVASLRGTAASKLTFQLGSQVIDIDVLIKTFDNGGQTTPFSSFYSHTNSCLFLSYGLTDTQVFGQAAIGADSAFVITHAVIYSLDLVVALC